VQLFSNSVADGLQFYKDSGAAELKTADATIAFVRRLNKLFDVLNARRPVEALRPNSNNMTVRFYLLRVLLSLCIVVLHCLVLSYLLQSSFQTNVPLLVGACSCLILFLILKKFLIFILVFLTKTLT
jgi:hypothetical protein